MSISPRTGPSWIWLSCLAFGCLALLANSTDLEQRLKLDLNGVPHDVHLAISASVEPLKADTPPLEISPIRIDRSVFVNSALLAKTISGLCLILGAFTLPKKYLHANRFVAGLIGWILIGSSLQYQ